MLRFFPFITLLIWCAPVLAQQQPERCKWIAFAQGMVQLDSFTVLPASIQIREVKGGQGPPAAIGYDFNQETQVFQFHYLEKGTSPDSLLVCYQVLPVNIHQPRFLRSITLYDSGGYGNQYQEDPVYTLQDEKEELLATPGIQKNGSITRGISMGNSQSLFVNSAMNLQLEGKLTDDIAITASFTDQQIPFQPEGNTRQIQEFDRIFVELRHQKGTLQAGDIVLKERPGEFLKFFKNVQGSMVQTQWGDSTHWGQSRIGGAIAKGQFHSQEVKALEGIAGPYRLTGPQAERFIIVLANSEKVFLDGKPLKRGFDYDYVIDYNTAEITFTNRVLITRFSRIRVDFEYAVQFYTRSVLMAGHRQRMGNLAFSIDAYQEKDNKNNPLFFELDPDLLETFERAGDSLLVTVQQAVAPTNMVNPYQTFYTLRDTVVAGTRYQIYTEASPTDSVRYQLSFVEVGPGQGNYVLGRPTANGRVYVWTAPLNGMAQGNFEPGRRLRAPDKRQMVTMGAQYHLNKFSQVFAEVAFSSFDQNLYSQRDAEDNHGYAVKFGYRNQGQPVNLLSGYRFTSELSMELTSQHFQGIDRFRSIEFDRDWSLQGQQAGAEDRIFNAAAGLVKSAQEEVSYRISYRERQGQLQGIQHWATLRHRGKWFNLQSQGFFMDTQLPGQVSSWNRLEADLSLNHRKVVPGYVFSMDKNLLRNTANDSLTATAMFFDEHRFYVRSGDSLGFNFRTDYSLREDQMPVNGELMTNTQAKTMSMAFNYAKKQQQVSMLFTYRDLTNFQDGVAGLSEETVMGRVDWKGTFLEKCLRSELSLATSAGRELKREFVFIQVEPGRGTHTWRDDNGDGRQDLNEFYEAYNPEERNFAKFFVPTDEYVPAYGTQLSYRLNLEGPMKWQKVQGIKALLSRLSLTTVWKANSRVTSPGWMQRVLPVFTGGNDEDMLANQSALRSTLFFNRRHAVYGFELHFHQNGNKQLLTNGFEARGNNEVQVAWRWNISKVISQRIAFSTGNQSNQSDFMPERNYLIRKTEWRPEWAYQPSPSFRLGTQYAFRIRGNQPDSGENVEKAVYHETGLNMRVNQAQQRNILGTLRWAHIQYKGQVNTPLGYEMLEGLQPGQNLTWTLNVVQKLSNGLQLNASYHGRKSPGINTVHVGRMQVTALF
jgi:hypothetical protein